MGGDVVGAGFDGKLGGPQNVRVLLAARIAKGGNVVNVDAEADRRWALNRRHGRWSP
jgi:hypothetical protein